MKEKEIIQYIQNNKDFLKEFHHVYFNDQVDYLTRYTLKDYMITAYVRYNKIKDFNDYSSFKYKYMLQLNDNIYEALKIYKAYYNCFMENMDPYLKSLKHKYNKSDMDIKIAYEIKTIWQFYNGFYDETCLINAINNNSINYSVLNRSIEDKHLLDNNYAIDVEIKDNNNNIMAIQCKQLSYVNLDSNKKEVHLNKHNKYRERFSNATYYILFKDNAPCYYIASSNVKSYLIASNDILNLSYKSFYKGSYEDLTTWLDNNKEDN